MTVMPTGREQVVKTYRYLRLSMVLLALVLAVSVGTESVRSHTVLDSISAYYYSPAKGVLVGALVAIGVGLVALRGNTDLEDILLNLSGMFAPVVAFVPTPQDRPRDFRVTAIDNNVVALLIGGAVAVVLATVLAATSLDAQGHHRPMRRSETVGLSVAGGVVLVGGVWISVWHDGFVANAHYTAAIGMFVFIALAVLVSSHSHRYRRTYRTVFVLMLASQLVWVLAPFWSHTVLAVEALMIGLFAVFWSVQTWELRYADLG